MNVIFSIHQVTNEPSHVVKNASLAADDKQQAGRHLLAAKYMHGTLNKAAHRDLISYIKLEGVDSIGHVSYLLFGTRLRLSQVE